MCIIREVKEMSKRLQITLTDEQFEELLILSKSLHTSKSAVIDISIQHFYLELLQNGFIKNEPCR